MLRCSRGAARRPRGVGSPRESPPGAPTDPDVRIARIRLFRPPLGDGRRRCGRPAAGAAGSAATAGERSPTTSGRASERKKHSCALWRNVWRTSLARNTGLDFYPSRGDELLSRLLRGVVDSGELANELLAEFHRGYPVSKLRLLLKASDGKTVAAGMWIASELGARARPVFDEIVELLHHSCAHVRFFALDCLVSCARPEDKQAINRGLDLVEDSDSGVRWKAMVFLATVPEAVLRAAKHAATSHAPASSRAKGLDLLLSSIASCETGGITARLVDNDAVLRRYAAAAAARVAPRDPMPLRHAMGSEDTTIKQFAGDMAKRAGIVASS